LRKNWLRVLVETNFLVIVGHYVLTFMGTETVQPSRIVLAD
jgi:hypothetical protein